MQYTVQYYSILQYLFNITVLLNICIIGRWVKEDTSVEGEAATCEGSRIIDY